MLALIDDYGGAAPGHSGTEWFGFSAVFIADANEAPIRSWFNQEILARIGRPPDSPVTLANLRSHNLRYHLVRQLAIQPIDIVVAAIRTERITNSRLQQPGWCYRYYGKEVINVATQYAKELQENARVILHEHSHWDELRSYLTTLECNSWYCNRSEHYRICFDRLVQCETRNTEYEPLLSLADWAANATYNALVPDRTWHATNPTYFNLISSNLWRGPSTLQSLKMFGFLVFPVPDRTSVIELLPADVSIPW